jgi:hypothetical protein
MPLVYIGTLLNVEDYWEYRCKNEKVIIRDIGDAQDLMAPYSVILHGNGRYYARLRSKYYSIDISDDSIEEVCIIIDRYLKEVDNLFIRLNSTLPCLVTRSFIQYAIDTSLTEGSIFSVLEIINSPVFIQAITKVINRMRDIEIGESGALNFIRVIYGIILIPESNSTQHEVKVVKERDKTVKKTRDLKSVINTTKVDPTIASILFQCQKSKSISSKRKRVIERFLQSIDHSKYPDVLFDQPKLSELLTLFIELVEQSSPTQNIADQDEVCSSFQLNFNASNLKLAKERKLLVHFSDMFNKIPESAWDIHGLIFPNDDRDSRRAAYQEWKAKNATVR